MPELQLNFFTNFMQRRLHSSSFSFSQTKIFCFGKFFLLPIILNIVTIVFRVRELMFVKVIVASR